MRKIYQLSCIFMVVVFFLSGCDGVVISYYLLKDLNGEKEWIKIYQNDSFGNEFGHPEDKEQVIKKEVCEVFARK